MHEGRRALRFKIPGAACVAALTGNLSPGTSAPHPSVTGGV